MKKYLWIGGIVIIALVAGVWVYRTYAQNQTSNTPQQTATVQRGAFNKAKAIAMKRMVNPRIVPLAWYREAWEEQEEVLGPDPWEYGMTEKNRNQLSKLVGYSHEQGMIKRLMPLEELFLSVDQGRKRGEEFRV